MYHVDFRGRELKSHKIQIPAGYEGLQRVFLYPDAPKRPFDHLSISFSVSLFLCLAVSLSLSLAGIVVREKAVPDDVEGRYLSGEERFMSLYIWGHDFTPDYSNQYLKALDWLGLADEVRTITILWKIRAAD